MPKSRYVDSMRFLGLTINSIEAVLYNTLRYTSRRSVASPPFFTILATPVEFLNGSTVRIEGKATPGRLRLLDCAAFLDRALLQVIEVPTFEPEKIRYAAISYPWRDLQLPEGVKSPLGSFTVHGAERADDVSVSVLRTACVAARYFGVELLWLDRICMIQSSEPDKVWQIEHMYSIYLHADPCLVFPGGLVRLACINDPTTWIERAWTLQEATATPRKTTVKCIYSFPYQSFSEFVDTSLDTSHYTPEFLNFLHNAPQGKIFTQYIIETNVSAGCDLADLLSRLWVMSQFFQRTNPALASDPNAFPIRIISATAGRLLKKSALMNIGINYMFYWQSAFVRSSSRPVDMVFSIMQSMGVKLNVASFAKNDRRSATIKLIQALLERGRPAEWLYIAPELAPGPELSVLPAFPKTSVSGRAMMQMHNGLFPAFDVIGLRESWNSEGAPTGSMDDGGYFHFTSRGVQVLQKQKTDAEVWGVVIGKHRELNRNPKTGLISSSPQGNPFPPRVELTLMFVELHGSSKDRKLYHRIGMEHEINEAHTGKWKWVENRFSVGGPGRGERVRFAVQEHGPGYASS